MSVIILSSTPVGLSWSWSEHVQTEMLSDRSDSRHTFPMMGPARMWVLSSTMIPSGNTRKLLHLQLLPWLPYAGKKRSVGTYGHGRIPI